MIQARLVWRKVVRFTLQAALSWQGAAPGPILRLPLLIADCHDPNDASLISLPEQWVSTSAHNELNNINI